MYCEWSGKTTKLYRDTRRLWRTFTTPRPVRSVQVTGEDNEAVVAITMEDGHTHVYQGSGRLIRR